MNCSYWRLQIQDAKFAPVDPTQPDGPQMAVLWGDPAKGPSAMLLKFKKGSNPLHIHNSDYHLVLVYIGLQFSVRMFVVPPLGGKAHEPGDSG